MNTKVASRKRGWLACLMLAVSAAHAGSGRVWHQLGVRDRSPGLLAVTSTNLTVLAGQMATLTSVSWGQAQPTISAGLDIAGRSNVVELTPGSQIIGPATVTLSAGTWKDYPGTVYYSPAVAIIATEPVDVGAQVMVESSADLRSWAPVGDALLPADPGTNAFYRVRLNPVPQSR